MPKKKKQDEKEEETIEQKEKASSKMDKQVYWVFGIMVGVIIVAFIAITLLKNSNNFEYNDMTFTKKKFGDINYFEYSYLTDKTTISTVGQVINTGEKTGVTITLRKDPRTNDVPVEGEIKYLPKGKYVYISFEQGGISCEYTLVALHNLGSFLTQNGFTIKPSSANEIDADESNLPYVNCENRPDNMVLLLRGGRSSIVKQGNCYILTVADCDVLSVTEKFMVQSIIDAKNEADDSDSWTLNESEIPPVVLTG